MNFNIDDYFSSKARTIAAISTILLAVILVILHYKFVVFLVLTFIIGVVNYILFKYDSPIDFAPIFSIAVIFFIAFGAWKTVLFILMAEIIPSIFGGGDIGIDYIFDYVLIFIAGTIMVAHFTGHIIAAGVILSVIYFVYSLIISRFFEEFNPLSVANHFIQLLINIFCFTTIAALII